MAQALFAIGLVLTGLGLWQAWEAVTVSLLDQTGTPNLFAMIANETIAMLACASFIAGSIFICAGAIVSRLNPPRDSV